MTESRGQMLESVPTISEFNEEVIESHNQVKVIVMVMVMMKMKMKLMMMVFSVPERLSAQTPKSLEALNKAIVSAALCLHTPTGGCEYTV